MYLEYFGLNDYPFDGLPDRRFYYVGGSQHQSITLLNTTLSRSGSICVLTGPSGAGKSTLVRLLMRSLPHRMRIIAIDDPRIDPHNLIATILRASGVVATSFESLNDLTFKLRKMLETSIANGIITTVICDEAQGLSDEVLEQIRLISNIEGEAGKMLNFLLVGRDDLIEHLNKPIHDMLKNRIKIFATLPPLTANEVGAYITYRLQQVGRVTPLFTDKAIDVITKKSAGAPRLINAIADMALNIAYQKKSEQVKGAIAAKAAYLVSHNEDGLRGYFKHLFKDMLSASLYAKAATIGAAFVCAGLTFVGALMLVQTFMPVRSIQSALINDAQVQARYQAVSDYLFRGRNAASRELYFFNQAVSESYFKVSAFATLFKVHGYAVDDEDVTVNSAILKKANLQSLSQTGPLSEAVSYNAPVLIGLIDDNLTPFYGVLYELNDDVAQMIIGNYLFAIKLDYLKERYIGEYTVIHPYVGDISDLKSRRTDTRKDMENKLRPYLTAYRQRALESANREANKALLNYERQKDEVAKLRQSVRQQLLSSIASDNLSDYQLEKMLQSRIGDALLEDDAYQEALANLKAMEKLSADKEIRADRIRTISLRLDDGYERAMNLFLQEQSLSEINDRAVALLTLAGYDGPRLLKSVPEAQDVTPAKDK